MSKVSVEASGLGERGGDGLGELFRGLRVLREENIRCEDMVLRTGLKEDDTWRVYRSRYMGASLRFECILKSIYDESHSRVWSDHLT